MNDSPGWASPGSSSSDPRPEGKGAQDDGQERTDPEATPQPPEGGRSSQWAPQQPPAAGPQGWGAPPPQGGAPGGWGGGVPGGWAGPSRHGPRNGWEGGSGWNNGWTPPPQAAKPGVIPLRPLGVGEILDGAVSTMRAHWRTVLSISLVVAVLTELVSTLATVLWLNDNADLDALANKENPTLDDLDNALTSSLSNATVTAVIGMLGTVFATGLLTVVISRAVLGRQLTIGEAWRDARPRLLRLLGLLILVPLLIMVATVACMLPAIAAGATGSSNLTLALLLFGMLGSIAVSVWIWIRYCLAPPALMLEKQGVITSMRRSAKLVRGSWWRVLGIQLLAFLLVMVATFVIQIPTTFIASALSDDGTAITTLSAGWAALTVSGIGSVIASVVSLPFTAGITVLLYLDLRIRREALDLELARAAGVTGYGPQQQSGGPEHPAPGS